MPQNVFPIGTSALGQSASVEQSVVNAAPIIVAGFRLFADNGSAAHTIPALYQSFFGNQVVTANGANQTIIASNGTGRWWVGHMSFMALTAGLCLLRDGTTQIYSFNLAANTLLIIPLPENGLMAPNVATSFNILNGSGASMTLSWNVFGFNIQA